MLEMPMVEVQGLGTLAVDQYARLLVDPEAVQSFVAGPHTAVERAALGGGTDQQVGTAKLATVCVHEFLHIALDHRRRGEKIGVSSDEEKLLFNLATDCSINCILTDGGWIFPGKPCLPEDFGFPRGLTAEDYYSRLLEKKQGKEPEKKKGPCSGQCGSCAGNPLPKEPKPEQGQARPQPSKGKTPGGGVPQEGQGDPGDEPGDGQEGEGSGAQAGLSEAALEALQRSFAEACQETERKSRGSVPGGLLMEIAPLLAEPIIPWQEQFAQVVGHTMERRPGAVDRTYARLSRRSRPGVGVPIMPAAYEPQIKAAVVLDTSGSMTREDLEQAMPEITAILAEAGGEITFCACDAKVHSLATIKTLEELMVLVKGGGGTSMVPALQALEDLPERPDIAVVITDGWVGAIGQEPDFSVVWCLVGDSRNKQSLLWGEVVECA